MKSPQIGPNNKHQGNARPKSSKSGLMLRTKEDRGILFITKRRVKYFPDAWLYSLDWYSQAPDGPETVGSSSEVAATEEQIVFTYLRHLVTLTGLGLTKLLPLLSTNQVRAISKTEDVSDEFAISGIEIEKRDEDDE